MIKKIFFFIMLIVGLPLSAMQEDPLDDSSEIIKSRLRGAVQQIINDIEIANRDQTTVNCLNGSQLVVTYNGLSKLALIHIDEKYKKIDSEGLSALLTQLAEEEISPENQEALFSIKHDKKSNKKKCVVN